MKAFMSFVLALATVFLTACGGGGGGSPAPGGGGAVPPAFTVVSQDNTVGVDYATLFIQCITLDKAPTTAVVVIRTTADGVEVLPRPVVTIDGNKICFRPVSYLQAGGSFTAILTLGNGSGGTVDITSHFSTKTKSIAPEVLSVTMQAPATAKIVPYVSGQDIQGVPIATTSILISFDRPISIESPAMIILTCPGGDNLLSTRVTDDKSAVVLNLATPLQNGATCYVHLVGVRDLTVPPNALDTAFNFVVDALTPPGSPPFGPTVGGPPGSPPTGY